MISQICEAFTCTPSTAVTEPLELCWRIIELRQYARVKQAVDQAKEDSDMPSGPMADLVFEIEAELYRERKARVDAERAERLRREAGEVG